MTDIKVEAATQGTSTDASEPVLLPTRALPVKPPHSGGSAGGHPVLPSPAGDAPVQEVADSGSRVASMDELFVLAGEFQASDIHLAVGAPPSMRIDGVLWALPQFLPLSPRDITDTLSPLVEAPFARKLIEDRESDGAWTSSSGERFRINLMYESGNLSATCRRINSQIPTMGDLDLPEVIQNLCDEPHGLILVTGPTGSGKSTTLAAMINYVNSSRAGKIITIEDPVEYVHTHGTCVVVQREVGQDTHGFAEALKHALRQDPDVILVGEMRDRATIATAVTAAETGHLVMSTVHSRTAPSTVSRIIDSFPAEEQAQIRAQLADSLVGIINQTLLPLEHAKGRVAAMEIMVATSAIRTMIRDSKIEQIPSALQSGAKVGMQTLDQHLGRLVRGGRVSLAAAMAVSSDPLSLAEANKAH